jgi:hypothetical protein
VPHLTPAMLLRTDILSTFLLRKGVSRGRKNNRNNCDQAATNRVTQPDLKDDRVVGSISPPGPPMVITPSTVPIPRARSSVIPPNAICEDSSLSCNWSIFSAGVKSSSDLTPMEIDLKQKIANGVRGLSKLNVNRHRTGTPYRHPKGALTHF